MSKSPLNPRDFPEVIDVIPPGALTELGIVMAVPVVEIYRPADQRKWCLAVHQWLDRHCVPQGCPSDDLLAEGVCRRSPTGGRCLLLLPFDHPEWQPSLRERYDPTQGAFVWRDQPLTPPPHRQPLTLEEVER